ncbi:MAG: glutamate-5-semialdehyde dehydrogenase [Alphaproteobacteria bacterium]|nr:glutamate-5-semialdehyde dehydrogenase [Alphaproteobacteria bacterium]
MQNTAREAPPANPLVPLGRQAKEAAQLLAAADTTAKNAALAAIAEGLRAQANFILQANARDCEAAEKSGAAAASLDRLRLTAERIEAIAAGVEAIAALPDPVGRLLGETVRPNGLRIEKRAVPLGVVGVIFESRPNVAVDAAALCLKAGNACILRGGSESWHSVLALTGIVQRALSGAGLPEAAVQTLPGKDRALVGALLQLDGFVDVIVPRGGKSLIERVRTESRIPVFSHLDGICHTYIDSGADPDRAVALTVNAKMRRPGICGATECLLLHRAIVDTTGTDVMRALIETGCEVRAPAELCARVPGARLAAECDYGHEFLAPVIAVAVVNDVHEAVRFINTNGSQHTDAIVTEDTMVADYFLAHVNSAIAMHNASTQFADGGEFGKGAEIGIATGKLHARGPVGLEELTTHQYRVFGNGQTRT